MQLPKAPEPNVAALPNPAQKIKETADTTLAKASSPKIQAVSKSDEAKTSDKNSQGDPLVGIMETIHALLNDKFDTMIAVLNENNDTATKLLNHSRA